MRRALVIAALICAAPVSARADDVAVAEALFQEARKLMDKNKWSEACPKLEESLRLDPGMGTRWHLARCYEKTRRLASAWAKYHEVAQEAKRDRQRKRAKAALRAAKKLEPKLVRLVIDVPREARIDGLVIVRNGAEVGLGAWGTKIPVDAGTLLIRASAPDREPWTKEIDVKPKARLVTVKIPRLELAPKEPPPDGPGPGTGSDPIVTAPPIETDATPWYEDRLGWVITGSGVAMLGVGVGALLHASSLEDQAKEFGPIEEREAKLGRADSFRTLGVVFAVVGIAATAAGAVKLAVPGPGGKPKESEPVSIQPSIGWGNRSILVGVGATF